MENEAFNTFGLIADLAWILLLGAIVTLLFKKLRQPVVLGYILAGFLASPKFVYLPSISNLGNIDFWAEIGIVVLMFCLGLEFSFKKLVNSGASAILTALIIISGMTFAGFGVGRLLHLTTINCIFLGGMISMSSTTIILKALSDLGLKQKKFASLVLAVLIIEDLFAVLMLVLLSSIAVGSVEGTELLYSVAKLMFFLVIWFVVGVYVLPSLLVRMRRFLNEETLLIVSMGLCFAMAVFSVQCGFSMELGAFVMGSILAGTTFAEKMERVVEPVKNLFGAVFFISVGMMVEPGVIATYWTQILILAVVVIAGMITFGTLGMLLTGQSLKVAMESGFTLTQIGEFSFIIASLGMSLNVLEPSLYPIIVAVSVITIFTTPYFIKMASPAYRFVESHLPKSLRFLIDRYSQEVRTPTNKVGQLWRTVLSRYAWRIVLYVVILVAILLLSHNLLYPFMQEQFKEWGIHIATMITIAGMLPFLAALTFSSSTAEEKRKLRTANQFFTVPLLAMRFFRYLIALAFLVYAVSYAYGSGIGWIVGASLFFVILVFASSRIKKVYDKMEGKFMDNLNIRHNARYGTNNNLVDDLHQAFVNVGAYSSFVGDRLRDTGLRRDFGISISSIRRGEQLIPLPDSNMRIFPGDVLGVIGTDEQIKNFNDTLEMERKAYEARATDVGGKVELTSLQLAENSPIIDKPLKDIPLLSEYKSMVVKVERADTGDFDNPDPEMVLNADDIVWVVGDPEKFKLMSGQQGKK